MYGYEVKSKGGAARSQDLFLRFHRCSRSFLITDLIREMECYTKKTNRIYGKKILSHHNNTTSHILLLVCNCLTKNNTVILPQSQYSVNFSSCNFVIFSKFKISMKKWIFDSIDEIKTSSLEELKILPNCAYNKYFEDWKRHRYKCQGFTLN